MKAYLTKSVLAITVLLSLYGAYSYLDRPVESSGSTIYLPTHEMQPVRAYDKTASGHIGIKLN